MHVFPSCRMFDSHCSKKKQPKEASDTERDLMEHSKCGAAFIRPITVFAGTVALVAASAGLMLGCGNQAPTAGPPPALPVTVVRVEPSAVPISGEWVGVLDGYVNAQIQPQANGYLIKQNYREGALVQKDQILFEIDPRPFQAALDQASGQLAQAKGQVEQAKAQLGLAVINVNRDTPLAKAHAIAQSQLDNDVQTKAQTQAGVIAAQASVAAAEAAVENAQINLGFTHVRSLITGIAGQATTQVGNLVNTQSVLTAVSQLDPIKVFFSISDSEYLGLTQRAREKRGDLLSDAAKLPLTMTLSNGEVFGHKGHIVYIDRQMNAQTGAIRIAAAFANPGFVLRPGQFARIKADTEIRQNGLLIPQVAVTEFQGQHQIYLAGSDGKAHVTNVELNAQVGTNWLVNSGVSAGDMVITDNLQKLRDGAPVKAQEGPSAASTAAASAPAAGR
jgi:membrane fusion protein, multidrug efflux system